MKLYECQRCLKKFGLAKMVMINAALPQGYEDFQLCVDCYSDSKVKVDPDFNYYSIKKRIHKAMKRGI